jgi:hypothetical protein
MPFAASTAIGEIKKGELQNIGFQSTSAVQNSLFDILRFKELHKYFAHGSVSIRPL